MHDMRDYLSYDPQSGVFTWIKAPHPRIAIGAVAGHVRPDGYRRIRFRGRFYLAHRLAWWFVHGVMPPEIDHRRGVAAGDGIENLRLATRSRNMANARLYCTNTSGFKGVGFRSRRDRWEARLKVRGHRIHLGYFDTAGAAARAYDAAAKEHFGDFARLNFN